MLAILTDPNNTSLNTSIIARGQNKPQISLINIIAYTRSMLGRNCLHLLTDPDISQLNATTSLLRYNQTKCLVGMPNEKITWAATLLAHTNVLEASEEGTRDENEDISGNRNLRSASTSKPQTA